ncbi:MAG: hypothetical protein ACHRXM_25150 [Isosphaerales bacterium]
MHPTRIVLALALGAFAVGFAARGPLAAQEQEAKRQSGKPAELEALNASYQAQLRAVESRWIADLAAWAEKAQGPKSDAAYRQLFNLAIARGLCPEAQAAAGSCLASASSGRDVRGLAALVQALSRADKGEHNQSLAELKTWSTPIVVVGFCLGLADGGSARAQDEAHGIPGYPSVSQFGLGYESTSYGGFGGAAVGWDLGSNPFSTAGYGSVGGFGSSPYGYGIGSGRIGSAYQSAGQFCNQAYQAATPQTTLALQPLYDVITSVPGWSRQAHRARRRIHSQPSTPRARQFDDNGKIAWPSTIPHDPAAARLRRTAEEAVTAVVHESKSTGHASVRPVIDAKNKLSAFERKVLPEVKTKNAAAGAALEGFFFNLDRALDALTYTY